MNAVHKILRCLVFFFAILFARDLSAQESETKIIFLNLVWEKGNIVLIDTAIRTGRVKQSKNERIRKDALVYELISDRNVKIGDGLFSNPSIEHLEYTDLENPEKIKLVVTKLDTATFTLRLPYTQNLARVDFFVLKSSIQQSEKKLRKAQATFKGNKIGSVFLKSATRR